MPAPEFRVSALSDLIGLAEKMPVADPKFSEAASARQSSLTKPPGSLGRLEGFAEFMAAWRATPHPRINTAQAIVFAGNHGVCDQGVNPYPQSVTAQMVANFESRGAAVNQLCELGGADLSVVPLDLDRPTNDFTKKPAMSDTECLSALNAGIRAVDTSADVLVVGEMGIGNSTVAAALAAAVFGKPVENWVGPGTGSDADGIALKHRVVEMGLARHSAILEDPIAVMAALGGRELTAICGAVLAARAARIPVILDGFICTAAVAPLYALYPGLLDHCLAGHVSSEPGHRLLLDAMGKEPILSLGMRLGEGSGAALALCVLRGALACHNGMATFEEAGVAGG